MKPAYADVKSNAEAKCWHTYLFSLQQLYIAPELTGAVSYGTYTASRGISKFWWSVLYLIPFSPPSRRRMWENEAIKQEGKTRILLLFIFVKPASTDSYTQIISLDLTSEKIGFISIRCPFDSVFTLWGRWCHIRLALVTTIVRNTPLLWDILAHRQSTSWLMYCVLLAGAVDVFYSDPKISNFPKLNNVSIQKEFMLFGKCMEQSIFRWKM